VLKYNSLYPFSCFSNIVPDWVWAAARRNDITQDSATAA